LSSRKSLVKTVMSPPKVQRTFTSAALAPTQDETCPLPRTCRKCGKPLLPDLPWCPQCYEPITQFAARAPLHHGDFVGSPIPTGGHIPHWSRWEKSATTFGPVGRVIATVLLVATLLPAITSGGFMCLIAFPIAAAVVLRAVSAKGRLGPDPPALPAVLVTGC